MTNEVNVQLFFRNLFLDFLDNTLKDSCWCFVSGDSTFAVPVCFVPENVQGYSNKEGIVIEESFFANSSDNYIDFSETACTYHLMIMDDRGNGLRLKRFVNLIKEVFSVGVYDIDSSTGLEILDVRSASFTSEENDTKVAIILSIDGHVFDLTR